MTKVHVDAGIAQLARPTALIGELSRRDPILCRVALVNAALFVAFGIGVLLDPRTVTGDPVWLKPAKFAGSIGLFAATVAWLGDHLPVATRTRRRVSIGIAAASGIEILLIGGQAARGVESHFNEATALDAAIYTTMGVTILAMTLLVAWLLARAWREEFAVAPAYAWGIRFGLLLFVLGALEGGVMVAVGDHALRPGASVPVFGWVLTGDFRPAHFLGLHALQVLPLIGYLAARMGADGRLARPTAVVGAVAVLYAIVLAGTFVFGLWPFVAEALSGV